LSEPSVYLSSSDNIILLLVTDVQVENNCLKDIYTKTKLAVLDLASESPGLSFVDDLPSDCSVAAVVAEEMQDETVLIFLDCGSVWQWNSTAGTFRLVHDTVCSEADCFENMPTATMSPRSFFVGRSGGVYVTDVTMEGTQEVLPVVTPGQRDLQLVVAVEHEAMYTVVKRSESDFGRVTLNAPDEAQMWIYTERSGRFRLQYIKWKQANDDTSYLDLLSWTQTMTPFQNGLVFTTDFGKSAYNIEPRAIRFLDSEGDNQESALDDESRKDDTEEGESEGDDSINGSSENGEETSSSSFRLSSVCQSSAATILVAAIYSLLP